MPLFGLPTGNTFPSQTNLDKKKITFFLSGEIVREELSWGKKKLARALLSAPSLFQSVKTHFHFLWSTCIKAPAARVRVTAAPSLPLKRLAEHLIITDADMASRVAALILLGLLCAGLAAGNIHFQTALPAEFCRIAQTVQAESAPPAAFLHKMWGCTCR